MGKNPWKQTLRKLLCGRDNPGVRDVTYKFLENGLSEEILVCMQDNPFTDIRLPGVIGSMIVATLCVCFGVFCDDS